MKQAPTHLEKADTLEVEIGRVETHKLLAPVMHNRA